MPRPVRTALALLLVVVAPLAGCSRSGDAAEAQGSLRVVDATIDVPPNPAQASVRFVIDNATATPDRLVAVSSPDAGSVSVHRTDIDGDGRATMVAVPDLAVPARSQVTFEPGGLHVMLEDPHEALVAGGTVTLELTFAEAGSRTVTAAVVAPGTTPTDGGPHDMEHTDAG